MDNENDRILTLENQWAARILGAGILFVLFLTLFPFDFASLSLVEALRRFDRSLVSPDFVPNILLFVPVGFGLTRLRVAHRKGRLGLAIALTVGLGLSLAVEITQSFLPTRQPSLSDILANTLGAGVGFGLACVQGRKILARLATISVAFGHSVSVPICVAALLLFTTVAFVATFGFRELVKPRGWNMSMPLFVGNEAGGTRPWSGKISNVVLAARAATPDEVGRLAAGRDPIEVMGKALLAYYPLQKTARLQDQSGMLPDFEHRGPGRAVALEDGYLCGVSTWLATPVAVAQVSQRIEQESQLTAACVITPALLDQNGPARLISISEGTTERNFTMGHQGRDLIVRLRTPLTGPNGTNPEFIFREVFSEVESLHVVFVYDGLVARAYVNGEPVGPAIRMTPEVNLLPLFRRGRMYIQFHPASVMVSRILYASCFFVPFGLLLRCFCSKRGIHCARHPAKALAVAVVGCAVLELSLAGANARPPEWKMFGLGLVLTLTAAGLWRCYSRPKYP